MDDVSFSYVYGDTEWQVVTIRAPFTSLHDETELRRGVQVVAEQAHPNLSVTNKNGLNPNAILYMNRFHSK